MEMDHQRRYDVRHFWGFRVHQLFLECWGWLVAFERCRGVDCRCSSISLGQGCPDLVCIVSWFHHQNLASLCQL
jgi:hypothetical protein